MKSPQKNAPFPQDDRGIQREGDQQEVAKLQQKLQRAQEEKEQAQEEKVRAQEEKVRAQEEKEQALQQVQQLTEQLQKAQAAPAPHPPPPQPSPQSGQLPWKFPGPIKVSLAPLLTPPLMSVVAAQEGPKTSTACP
jgi:hypothetical protein